MALLQGVPTRLLLSYVADWLIFILFVVLSYIFNSLPPKYHSFSVLDLSISYPYNEDTVPIWVAGVVALIPPAAIIVVVVFTITPSRAIRNSSNSSRILRLRLWEWHAGWLGLAMSLSTGLVVATGLKNFGKPRPYMLARCIPDLSRIVPDTVGGYGQDISPKWAMVTVDVCTQPDKKILNDGFQSWPSGHSTFAWAGLFYLTLFLASKFSIRLPQLPVRIGSGGPNPALAARDSSFEPPSSARMLLPQQPLGADSSPITNRDEAAGAPAFMLIAILIPCAGALYITLSRYSDNAHHGFDILSGSLIGITSAYVAFRWYHPPLATGTGWAWGPRSSMYAFGSSVGTGGYVGEREYHSQDIEMGRLR